MNIHDQRIYMPHPRISAQLRVKREMLRSPCVRFGPDLHRKGVTGNCLNFSRLLGSPTIILCFSLRKTELITHVVYAVPVITYHVSIMFYDWIWTSSRILMSLIFPTKDIHISMCPLTLTSLTPPGNLFLLPSTGVLNTDLIGGFNPSEKY